MIPSIRFLLSCVLCGFLVAFGAYWPAAVLASVSVVVEGFSDYFLEDEDS